MTIGIEIREPEEGGGSPRVPRPPAQLPPRTPPPPPEMEVDQKTPDPKGGVQEEVQESAAEHRDEDAVMPNAEGFTADIAREVEAFVLTPEEEAEVIIIDSAEKKEDAEPSKTQEAPSSSFPSFQTLQSGEMGFSAPRMPIPDHIWDLIWGQNREGAAAYFGNFAGMSEVDRARIWSLKATAGMGESSRSVPDPARSNQLLMMQVILLPCLYLFFNSALQFFFFFFWLTCAPVSSLCTIRLLL